ncbi:hypothetical protein E4T56_gene12671 [Termitomyces sp. T112]|nr:hypothetical protein E4T56_gene12671 [Termitomyces sp. T112]
MSSTTTVYKGKVTHRSWPQLPEELLRTIGTFYLLDASSTSYCPQTWESREAWHHRMVYTALRDANELERHMMSICPQWHAALQHHFFWNQAIALIDPTDALGHHQYIAPRNGSLNSSVINAQPTRISPFHHFRNISRASCFVCRVNVPNSTTGLANAKRLSRNHFLHTIALCREHDRHPTSYCGMCLRAAPFYDAALLGAQETAAAQQEHIVGVIDNDDKESFPNVEATCRSCRIEWLWKRAGETPGDREAIGGHRFDSSDWETRNVVDSFIDLAEGSINDVLLLAREKLWLKKNTRLDFMLKMLKKTNRVDNEGLEGLERYEEEEDSSDSEDDIELLQMEETHVRDMALGDWARARILDGHWMSPADTWYHHTVNGYKDYVAAVHPCPWTCSPSSDSGHDDETGAHPLPSTLKGTIPPTFGLCEQAFSAHQRQLKEILVPPMRNLVRKIVIECQTPGMGYGRGIEDPAVRASKMSVEDVLAELRNEEGVWLNGFDWVQRKMNDTRERDKKRRNSDTTGASVADSDDSSTSSGSRSSNGTSPVLSTTTLQTTPSPPPLPIDEKKDERAASDSTPALVVPVMISIDPVEDPPRPIHTVPYIPTTAAHLPPYTMDALKSVWREACAPLYRCRCSICLRAAARAHANARPQSRVKVVPSQIPTTPAPQPVELSTVKLEEIIDVDGEGEDEIEDDVDTYDEDEEENTEDLMEEVREAEGSQELESTSASDGSEVVEVDSSEELSSHTPPTVVIPRARKRSSDELEVDFTHDEDENDKTPLNSADVWSSRAETPPKRARTDERDPSLHQLPTTKEEDYSRRLRKRSSEELEDAPRDELSSKSKKIKVSSGTPSSVCELVSESSPPTLSDVSSSRPSSVPLSTSTRTSDT